MKLVVAALSLFVCVALVHSVPLSKGQSTTNVNRNTNNNVNYNFLYDYLFSLLQNTEQEEPIDETPIYKPPVHKPNKPCKNCHPVRPDDEDEDDEEDDGSYKPEMTTDRYDYIHHKPTVSIHKPCKHCPAKPLPYPPHRPSGSYDDRKTVNKNSNVASNTNVNDANLAGEADVNGESDWGKALVKRTPETLAAEKTEPEAAN